MAQASTNATWINGGLGDTNGWSKPSAYTLEAPTITPRHTTLTARIREGGNGFQGRTIGDSICAGTGATSGSKRWQNVFGAKMVESFGGLINVWTPFNDGVGGETIANVLPYLAHKLDNIQNPSAGVAFSNPYWVLCIGRNDSAQIPFNRFSKLYRTAVRQAIRAGIEVFCMTENPMYFADGTENDPNYPTYADEIRRIAAEEGASLIDVHLEFRNRQARGENPLLYLTGDRLHPNDSGHAIYAQMLYDCMTGISQPAVVSAPVTPARNGNSIVGQYAHVALNNASVVAVSGIVTSSTARARQTGTNDVVEVQSGGYVEFEIQNCKAEYLIATLLGGTGNTGTATIQSPPGTDLITGVSATALVQEHSVVIDTSTPADPNFPTARTVRIVAVGGKIQVLHVATVSPIQQAVHATVKGTEVGTWSDMVSQTLTWRSSSTVGDTITIDWYGTDLAIDVERGTDRGTFGYVTDGSSKLLYDSYLASATVSKFRIATGLAKGWHKTVLSIETKNASSSAATVNMRRLRTFSQTDNNGRMTARIDNGITAYAPNGTAYVRSYSTTVPTVSSGTITSTTPMNVEVDAK